jgi:hypothetical protein
MSSCANEFKNWNRMMLQNLPNKYNDLIVNAVLYVNYGDDDKAKLAPNIISAVSFNDLIIMT